MCFVYLFILLLWKCEGFFSPNTFVYNYTLRISFELLAPYYLSVFQNFTILLFALHIRSQHSEFCISARPYINLIELWHIKVLDKIKKNKKQKERKKWLTNKSWWVPDGGTQSQKITLLFYGWQIHKTHNVIKHAIILNRINIKGNGKFHLQYIICYSAVLFCLSVRKQSHIDTSVLLTLILNILRERERKM